MIIISLLHIPITPLPLFCFIIPIWQSLHTILIKFSASCEPASVQLNMPGENTPNAYWSYFTFMTTILKWGLNAAPLFYHIHSFSYSSQQIIPYFLSQPPAPLSAFSSGNVISLENRSDQMSCFPSSHHQLTSICANTLPPSLDHRWTPCS